MNLQAMKKDCQLTDFVLNGSGKIHSLFHSTVNLLLENGCFFTLCAPLDDYGPNGIILEKPICFSECSLNLQHGQKVLAGNGNIKIGKLCIKTQNAKSFSCRLPSLSSDISMQQTYRAKTKALSSMKNHLRQPIDENWASQFQARTKQFHSAVVSNRHMIPDSVKKLIGFGSGSTPSGDDFLTGCLSVLFVCLETDTPQIHTLCQAIREYAERTTCISKQMLMQACNRQVMDSLRRWVLSLYQDESECESAHLERLLCIGATSGYDMAAGVIEGTQILWEIKQEINK